MKLIRELAEFERAPEAVINTEQNLLNDGFGKHPVYKAIVAEAVDTNDIIGMAVFCTMYSTWKGKILYLDDLLVTESYRQNGIGRKLMNAFLKEATEEGVNQVRWQVLDWNTPAIKFYESLGVQFDKEWITVKMSKEQMETYLSKQ
jgi:ribosomal protein S18 acetylase RimI-like enzyme